MKEFVSFVLIHYGFLIVLEKYNIKALVSKLSKRLNSRFIYEVSECDFCLSHHIGFIILVPFMMIREFNLIYLLYPFMSISLIYLIKKKNNL